MVKNRTEMYSYFTNIISNNYDITENIYRKGNNAVKSYIVETHNYEFLERDAKLENLKIKLNEMSTDFSLSETEDESILIIKKDSLEIFGDISNKRFMLLHTGSKSNETDDFFNKITFSENFDNVWMPDIFLAELLEQGIGEFYGVKVRFQNMLSSDEDVFNEKDTDLDLTTKSETAKEVMTILMNSKVSNKLGLSKLALKNIEEYDEENAEAERKYMIDDVYYNGKITAKGNSFNYHISTVTDILRMYDNKLKEFEEMSLNMKNGFLEGKVFKICFSEQLDARKLVKHIFNGSKPFKLFGMDEEITFERYKVYAVDLHNGNGGNMLTFHVSNQEILFSINDESCANTIFRLLANLNHYVDASATLEVGGGIYDKKIFRTGFS